ncbi:glycosyltransferase family 2 protein [Megamonas sp.]
MNIVITMGGLGSRFKKAGYIKPKYMIEVKGKTLFEWSLKSLSAFKKCKHIFIVKKEDNALSFINDKCNLLGIKNFNVLEIDYLTRGQAETAVLAEKYWSEKDSLFIYNIDTYIEEGILNLKTIKGDGFIPCFKAFGDHWSFVKTNENDIAVEVREKKRISENCSVGAYYFSSCELFKVLYHEFYGNNENVEAGEQYIAPMYNLLIKNGGKVYIQDIDADAVHVLGTPEEVKSFEKENSTF